MQQDNAQTIEYKLNDINFNCQKHPHNVLAHRRVKNTKVKEIISNQINKTTQITQQTPLSSSLAESIIQEEQVSRFGDEDRQYTQQFQDKIKTLDVGSKFFLKDRSLVKKQQLSQKFFNQKSYMSQTDWRKHRSKDSSKITSLEKQRKKFPKQMLVTRKGPLQQKHLINWLNFVISEYCLQDTTSNSLKGLQRFALDKNTLLSKGMTSQNIFRVYQTIFAHSFGLQGSVEQLCASKRDIIKAVWKVYALLLQYCSKGSFQTIMGELQRDMISNQKRLLAQIQKRQAIINRNDEIMQQKLEKYEKENKQLRKAVEQYQGKVDQLEAEFREIEIAYNMEVRLRLNYEHKINKIYSVHERLNILHNSLLRDFKQTDVINKKMTVQNKKTIEKNIELKADYKLALAQIQDQLYKLRENELTIQALRMNQEQWKQKLNKEITIKDNEKQELRQKEKRINQLEKEMKGLNLMIEMMKNSANSQFEQYRRVSTENAQLKLINSSQLQKINELVNQVNYLNKKQSKINIELNHFIMKTDNLTEQLSKRDDQISDLKKQLQKKQIELNARMVQLQSLRKTDESLRKNMKEIKNICEKLQEQANTQRKFATQINQQYTTTHQQKLELQLKMKQLYEEKFEMELDLNRRISDILNLRKKYQAQNTEQIKKYEKLHNVWSGQDKSQTSMAQQLANANQELEKANLRINFLSRQFSDLNFEKAKIQGMYKDNLILHEKEKRAEKDLMIEISTLKEKLQDANRQLTMQNKTHMHQLGQWQKEKEKLLAVIAHQKIQIEKKQGFVHPMLLDDALHTLQRQQQNHRRTRMRFQNDIQMQNEKNMKLKMQMQKKQAQFRQYMKDNEKKIEQTRTQLEREREYFRIKTEELRALNYTLQTKINYQKKEIEKKFQQETNNDSKLMQIMKQKNAQIQELLVELERIEDNYQKKSVQFEQEIKSIYQQNDATISNLKEEKKQLQTQIGNIEKEYQTKLVQKQKQMQEVILALKKPQESQQGQVIRKGKSLPPAPVEMKRSQFIAKLKIATIFSKK